MASQLVKLLPHQATFVQSPYVYPDIRFHFLVGGFACGKTSSLVYSVMNTVKLLLGKKDKEGHNPKLMVCSKNITFLAKTWTNAFIQNLKMTNSEYTFDKAKNIITVGNVEIILVATEEPENIYGYCFEGNTPILTDNGNVPIKEIKAGDYVLTTKGYKKVKKAWCTGIKDCIEVDVEGNKILCTPEHHFIDVFDNNIKAKDLTKMTSLVKVDNKEWKKWQFTNGLIERSLKLLISMVSDITDTQNQSHMENGVISPVQTKTSKEVTQLITEICGNLSMEKYQKDTMYTTKMETISTTLLKILSFYQELNILSSTGKMTQKEDWNKLEKQCKDVLSSIEKSLKTLCTENSTSESLEEELKVKHLKENVVSVEKILLQKSVILLTALMNVRESLITDTVEKLRKEERKTENVLSAEKSLRQTDTALLKLAHLTAKTSNVVGQYEVYDIEVEDCHEFFANGIRVHNSVFACWVDELDELPTQTAMEAVRSVNDRVRQQIEGMRSPFICFATTSQGLKGLYQTVMHFDKSGIGYVIMRARTKDNTFLPEDYVKNMYSIYNEKEVRCLLEGEFISIDSGLIFPDYNPALNKLDYDLYDYVRDNGLDVYIGQDFNVGFHNAVAFAVIEGNIIAIKDYEFPDIRRAPEVFRYDFPESKIVWIPDMTYKEHFSEFKKELRLFRITIAYRSCNPLVNDRNFACNKLFYAERLFICPMCKDTETTLLTWQKDPKTGQPSKGGKGAPDHKGDCVGMVVHYLLSWNRELKPLYSVTLERLYDKRRARGADAAELEIPTQLMTADRIKSVVKRAPNVEENAFNPA